MRGSQGMTLETAVTIEREIVTAAMRVAVGAMITGSPKNGETESGESVLAAALARGHLADALLRHVSEGIPVGRGRGLVRGVVLTPAVVTAGRRILLLVPLVVQ